VTQRPILFSSPMVLAILAKRKTQTRRIAKATRRNSLLEVEFVDDGPAVPVWQDSYILDPSNREWLLTDAAAQPGDSFWVREAWRIGAKHDRTKQSEIDLDHCTLRYEADGASWDSTGYNPASIYPTAPDWMGRYRPGMHMPRTRCRLGLPGVDVRLERLHCLTEADARSEGIFETRAPDADGMRHFGTYGVDIDEPTACRAYRALWVHLNGQASWNANPLVWVYSFADYINPGELP
jgi:hypothetical protein